MAGPFRIQVDDEHGPAAVIVSATDEEITRVEALADEAVEALTWYPWVTGAEHAREILLAELTRLHSDDLAAARVASRPPPDPQGCLF